MWLEDLDDLRRRMAALDPEALSASARESVVRWRDVSHGATLFLPLPPVLQDVVEPGGDWLDEPSEEDRGFGTAVGLDEDGRPVLAVVGRGSEWERTHYAWSWSDDGSFLELELMGSGPHLRRARVQDGRVTVLSAVSEYGGVDVRFTTWDGDRLVRVVGATASRWDSTAVAMADLAGYDAAGRLWVMRRAMEDAQSREEPAPDDMPLSELGLEAAVERAKP